MLRCFHMEFKFNTEKGFITIYENDLGMILLRLNLLLAFMVKGM